MFLWNRFIVGLALHVEFVDKNFIFPRNLSHLTKSEHREVVGHLQEEYLLKAALK